MKYKVLLARDLAGGGSPDGMSAVTFYKLNQAVICSQQWAALASSNVAWLWDGSVWRFYT